MSEILQTIGRTLYKLAFEISPIVLNNGLADSIFGGMLPIVVLTEGVNFVNGLINGDVEDSLDAFFAHFRPMPGGTLLEFDIGEYPFANQAIAANALIARPLRISMMMEVPVNSIGGYGAKFITFLALQAALAQHAQLGGTYTVVTPTFIYSNVILRQLRDISDLGSKQPQNRWAFDFEQPLITAAQAQAAQNSLMSQLSNGTPISGQPTWSGPGTAGSPASAPGVGTGGNNLVGTNVGGYQPSVSNPPTTSPLPGAS